MKFEWDPEKAAKNLRLHRVGFDEAFSVFSDDLSITIFDPKHSADEDRYLIIGMSNQNRLLLVAHTERGDRIRIISARELTKQERQDYESGNFS